MIQYSNINDAWGNNKEIFKKNVLNNNLEKPADKLPESIPNTYSPRIVDIPLSNTPVLNTITSKPSTNIIEPNIPISNKPINTEHFKSCSYAEHFKVCESCRNSMLEHFKNLNTAKVNLLGTTYFINKDVLKTIFIILIVLIFIILLSMVNIPVKEINIPPAHMKYLMMNQMQYPYQNLLHYY